MQPVIVQAVAEARIADLHRKASTRRRIRLAAARPGIGITVRNMWWTGRRAVAGWTAANSPVRATTSDPACCAA
jgi:hypothetical protein